MVRLIYAALVQFLRQGFRGERGRAFGGGSEQRGRPERRGEEVAGAMAMGFSPLFTWRVAEERERRGSR
jgi:hypothetical protein